MDKTDTNNLKQELMQAPDLDNFLSENVENFSDKNASEMLYKLFERRNLSKACLARHSCISEVYLHQIFSGKRNPSRNRLICICFGLEASLDETQELLKLCGFAPLYPKNRRDAIIIFAIINKMELSAINDKLFIEKEETLF